MILNKAQLIVISIFLALFIGMWLGCETKPNKIKELEKSRALTVETTGIENLMAEAQKSISVNDWTVIQAINAEINNTDQDSIKSKIHENLASKWYELGNAAISGWHAEESAKLRNDDFSWSIAGTTYLLCVKTTDSPKIKTFCSNRAIASFEKAISIQPEDINNRINLALCYVENPPSDSPMTGILMLRELNSKYPDNVAVLNQLARLALKTNQVPKAIERLEMAISKEPDNMTSICLLAEAYFAVNNREKSEKYQALCQKK